MVPLIKHGTERRENFGGGIVPEDGFTERVEQGVAGVASIEIPEYLPTDRLHVESFNGVDNLLNRFLLVGSLEPIVDRR